MRGVLQYRYRFDGALVAGLSLSAYRGTTTWRPTYLVKERGLSVSGMGMFMTVLSVGMFIGYQLFAGWRTL